jgi:hypothetical protein
MVRAKIFAAAIGASILGAGVLATGAAADPWKDESGKGRERGELRYDDRGRDWDDDDDDDRRGGWRERSSYGVPRGHLPPPGLCRVWFDGRPPGQQPAPVSCERADRIAARRGDARVIDSRGRDFNAYANYSRRYRGEADDRYERGCAYWGPQGECIPTRPAPRW